MKRWRIPAVLGFLALAAACVPPSPSQIDSRTPQGSNTPPEPTLTEPARMPTGTPTYATLTSRPTTIPTATPTPTAPPLCVSLSPPDTVSGTIALVLEREGNFDIYSIRADGSGLTRLTNSPARDVSPLWSPDGKKIAFVSGSSPDTSLLFLLNADGSGPTLVTPALDFVPPAGFVWSPDDRYIALSGAKDGLQIIYVADIDTLEVRVVVPDALGSTLLTWSPGGETLAFDAALDIRAVMLRIFLADLAGDGSVREIQSSALSDSSPQWQPNGPFILYQSMLEPGSLHDQLFLMRADGSERRQITASDTAKGPARWSPDGRLIAYGTVTASYDIQSGYVIHNRAIHVYDVVGATDTVLIEGIPLELDTIAWGPDSRHLAFLSSESGTMDLYVVDICNGKPRMVAADVAMYAPAWKP